LLLSVRDFIFYKNFKEVKNGWLKNHITKMLGAYIASVTAFMVAGIGYGSLIAWLTPSIIGTFYIIYWRRKVSPKKVAKSSN